jgi:diacylglycerol O-acyltransferase
VKRLGGWDAVLLYSETPNVHMHTLKVAVFDASDCGGRFDFTLFRRTLNDRLPLLEPLRYRLVDIPFKLHHPMWQENTEVDLDYHIRRRTVAAPGGRRELDELIGEIASSPLDRSRPLWEFHFVEGMAEHRFAVIGKVHHALADGIASANLLARALDPRDGPHAVVNSSIADPPPSKGQLLRVAARDHLDQVKRVPGVLKYTAKGIRQIRRKPPPADASAEKLARNLHPPATFLNHVLSPERMFATTTVALAEIKSTSRQLGVTLNDLILAIAAGGLRELLLRYDGHADAPIIASVAVGLDTSPDRVSGNRLSAMTVSLPVQVTDPLEWVRLAHLGSEVAKENHRLLGPELMSRWSNYVPPALAEAAFRRMATRDVQNKLYNLAVSNVPGPRERGSLADVPLSEFYSVGPLTAGSAVNITVWSYVDQINISVIADRKTLDDPHEVTDAMVEAFARIREAAGLSAELVTVDTAMPR